MRFERSQARRRVAVAFGTSLVLLASACGGGGGGGGGGSDNKTVSIWTSVDQPVIEGLKAALEPKAKAAGITVNWTRIDNINQLIMTKIQANDAPDIAMIPQPGVVADIVKRNKAFALDDVVDMNKLKQSMLPGTLDTGTVDGKLYGLLVSANVKSLVFYPKKAWDAAGYKVPTTIDELNALTDKIRADGGTPWCMGIESAAATGWPATDWFEDLVMRYGGADTYNKWVKHEVKFDSDVVRKSAAEFEKLMFTKGNVPGGRGAIASTSFQTAANPMFEAKPGCWLLKQGSFITNFFPTAIKKNLDTEVGVFGFPPATAGGENPVLGGGDLATLLTKKDSAKQIMKMLGDTDEGNAAAKTGSFVSPHKDFDVKLYPNSIMKSSAEVAGKATTFLFDGSDQMPGAVGAGTFWKDMTAWISGQESLDQALKDIDQSWPS